MSTITPSKYLDFRGRNTTGQRVDSVARWERGEYVVSQWGNKELFAVFHTMDGKQEEYIGCRPCRFAAIELARKFHAKVHA